MASSEDRKEELERESFYKTKIIQFLGRTTPIILQNDNGPCPLLAICNVLLLKNNLNLSVDVAEISQEKLLSLVAERLIDSNSNVNNRSDGYAENQQKNIADAIDLLPRLATGIDVNIKFRRIDDFEFTRECAIFDLLDIPVYHGWIVDPQDHDTASAIGSKSYNTLVEEVVALVTQNVDRKCDNITEDDCVDFAAATAATLGVPSPCLSRGRSFNDSPHSVLDEQKLGKGEKEEEAELLRALNLSEEPSSQVDSHLLDDPESEVVVKSSKSQIMHAGRILEGHNDQMQLSILDDHTTPGNDLKRPATLDTMTEIVSSSSSVDIKNGNDHLTLVGSGDNFPCKYVDENSVTGKLVLNGSMEHQPIPVSVDNDAIGLLVDNEVSFSHSPGIDQSSPVGNSLNSPAGDSEHQGLSMSTSNIKNATDSTGLESTEVTSLHLKIEGSDTSVGRAHDITDTFTSSVRDDEPMYEGEECVLDAGKKVYEEKEPMYEGEVVLAKQSYKDTTDAADVSSKNELTDEKGELKRNFLVNNASQLSIYGLFCLQEGLKERELCVFFRNNHFNTMFKFDGQLYLLVTDQGYINQPDLVWERLNEVNGNTVFVTSDFKEFKAESNDPSTWDERKAVTNTAGFLSSIDPSKESSCSDFQLAVALQQQEFEQQPERHNVPQTTASSGSSRLVTGPQRSSVRPTPPRQEAKSKEKCIVM